MRKGISKLTKFYFRVIAKTDFWRRRDVLLEIRLRFLFIGSFKRSFPPCVMRKYQFRRKEPFNNGFVKSFPANKSVSWRVKSAFHQFKENSRKLITSVCHLKFNREYWWKSRHYSNMKGLYFRKTYASATTNPSLQIWY